MGPPCDPAVPGAQPAPVQLVTARSLDGGSSGGAGDMARRWNGLGVDSESRRRSRRDGGTLILRGGVLLLAISAALGCATKGDFRKLEERVLDASRSSEKRPDPFERIAVLAAEVEALRTEQRRLSGQLEVARKTAEDGVSYPPAQPAPLPGLFLAAEPVNARTAEL